MASIIDKIFKRIKPEPQATQSTEVMSGSPAHFTPFSGNAYENDIYRSAVDAIARNAGKLKITHIVQYDGSRKEGDRLLNRILQTRPNPYISAYDLIYKLTTHYFLYNNAFAYLEKDQRGDLKAVWPIRPQAMEYVTDLSGKMFCKFFIGEGKIYILPFDDVFTIRRHFNSNDLLGDNNTAIVPTLDLAHTQNEGMGQSIKSGATIRGILKYNQVLSPQKLKEEKEAFIKDYLTITNSGGIAAIDSKSDYTPLENNPINIDEKQLQAIKNKVYEYLGISESIVNSTYTEDEWLAFYESVIEPLALQCSLELTEKVFTEKEQEYGNAIMFEANRLQFANNTTKTKLLKELMPLGLFTVNQALEMLNMPTVDKDGDKRLQTLNVVSTEIVDDYQMTKKLDPKVGGKKDEGN